jgi:hypothetical protein
MRIKSFIAVVSLIIGVGGIVAETPARGAEADVHAALQRWVEALGSGKGEAPIAALYAPEAILLSTFDPKPLETPAAIAAYFQKLTQNPNLKATVQTEKVQTFADGGADSGLYTFSYTKEGSSGAGPLHLRVSPHPRGLADRQPSFIGRAARPLRHISA